jgi:hypothetical protein
MKQYKVSLWLNGTYIKTVITANDYSAAVAMVKAQYPTATSISITSS